MDLQNCKISNCHRLVFRFTIILTSREVSLYRCSARRIAANVFRIILKRKLLIVATSWRFIRLISSSCLNFSIARNFALASACKNCCFRSNTLSVNAHQFLRATSLAFSLCNNAPLKWLRFASIFPRVTLNKRLSAVRCSLASKWARARITSIFCRDLAALRAARA